jgi:hypothetical protein
MSPEQAAGEGTLTPASDFYALGVVLYEMLAGEYPYKLGDPPNYLLAHVTGTPIPLVTRVGDVPHDLEQVVHRLLAKEPADRYDTAEALVPALRGDADLAASGERRLRARRRRRWLAPALGLLAAAAAVAGATLLGRPREGVPDGVDPRRSVLVGFFDNTQQRAELDWLRVGGVDLLAQALGSWRDLTVIDAERLLDLARRLELDPKARLSQEDVLRLARQAGVWTATAGTVSQFGDSVSFALKVYDVASGQLLTTATARIPADGDVPGAFRALAQQVLALAGAPARLADVEPPTRSLAAYRAYIEGIQAQSRWDMAEAVPAFERAVAADSAFALAWYELSQAQAAVQAFDPDNTYIAYADSALRYAQGRPPKERALIAGYHALMHADPPEARRLLGELVREDSLQADAWFWLGVAAQTDATLRRDPAGREVMPADYTLALRSYTRALELDGSDHRIYAQLAFLLTTASQGDGGNGIPAFRDPPPNANFTSINLRTPTRWYAPVLRGDAVELVPTESLAVRLAPAALDSLRQAARDRAAAVVRRWITVAPDEGNAYLMLAGLEYRDRSYDAALRALAKAESLQAFTQVPVPLQRLAILLEARRFDAARVIGDSVAPLGRPALPLASPLFGSSVAGHLFARGRVGDASGYWLRSRSEIRRFGSANDYALRLAMADSLAPVSLAARAGTLTPAMLERAEAVVARRIAAVPEGDRPALRRFAARTLLLGAAALGDTARARAWRAAWGTDSLPGLDAAAHAAAGDIGGARERYARAARDTTSEPVQLFALGVTALALGRPADALAHLGRLDSAEVVSVNWLLGARAYALRGDAAAALGDTVAARAHYDTFLDLWQDADAPLQPEREAVRRRRAELDRPSNR